MVRFHFYEGIFHALCKGRYSARLLMCCAVIDVLLCLMSLKFTGLNRSIELSYNLSAYGCCNVRNLLDLREQILNQFLFDDAFLNVSFIVIRFILFRSFFLLPGITLRRCDEE